MTVQAFSAGQPEVHALDKLPPALQAELEVLEAAFTVDGPKLKQISQRFEEELREGLASNGCNIVGLVL